MASACPACSGADFEVVLSRSRGLQFLNDRRCRQCGTRWRPACPMWGAATCAIGGALLFLAIAAGLIHSHQTGSVRPGQHAYAAGMVLWIETLLGALGAAVYGACVLAGVAGSGGIVEHGAAAERPAPDLAAQVVAAPRPTARGVRWFHFAVAALLPFVGLPWGMIELLRERWKPGLLLITLSALCLAFILLVLLTLVLAYVTPLHAL